MRILVTGATGFVGRALVRHLALEGHDVLAVVRREGDKVQDATCIVVPDIAAVDWSPILKDVDTIVHLAARVHQMNDNSADPLAAFRRVNRDATIALAEAAVIAQVKRFVFLSSVKAAIDQTGIDPVNEAHPANPESSYGISKREAELALLEMRDLSVVILRPPLIYGSGVRANFRLLMKLARVPLLPLGAVRNRRSMLGLGNLLKAIELSLTVPAVVGKVYYLSDGDALSTPELLKRIAATMRRPIILLPVPVIILRVLAKAIGQGNKIDRLTESLAVNNAAFRYATGWQPEPMEAELKRMFANSK